MSAGLPYITTEISVYLPRSSQAGTMQQDLRLIVLTLCLTLDVHSYKGGSRLFGSVTLSENRT